MEQWSVAIGAVTIITLALSSERFQRILHYPAVRYLGKISYSLYLVHVTVLFSLIYIFHGAVNLKILPLYLGGSLGLASIFWYLVERPAMLLGQRLGVRFRGFSGRRVEVLADRAELEPAIRRVPATAP